MLIPIPSNYQSFVIQLTISSDAPLEIGVRLFDAEKRNSHYLRRKAVLHPSGASHFSRKLSIPIPVSPKKLFLEIVDKSSLDQDDFTLDKLTVKRLTPTEVWASPIRHRFMKFAIDFAQQAGTLQTGSYYSKDKEFLIQYLPSITDEFGNELATPARISRQFPRIQLSKRMFLTYSIPVRIAILAHEACHYFLNTRSEKEADLCGIKYYLESGFPSIEAIYALTKIFGKNPTGVSSDQVGRTYDVGHLVNSFQQNRNYE